MMITLYDIAHARTGDKEIQRAMAWQEENFTTEYLAYRKLWNKMWE